MSKRIRFIDVGNLIQCTKRQTNAHAAPGVARRYVVIAFKLEDTHNSDRPQKLTG